MPSLKASALWLVQAAVMTAAAPANVPRMTTSIEGSSESALIPRVVGTVATIPARLPFLRETVESLLGNQTMPLDALVVVLPRVRGGHGGDVDTPRWLTDMGGQVTVIRTERDWGSAGKLLPVLAIHRQEVCGGKCEPWIRQPPLHRGELPARWGGTLRVDKDTRIITFDDDRVYEPWAVELLVRASLAQPDAAIGTEGHNIDGRGYTGEPRWCARQLKGVGAKATVSHTVHFSFAGTLKTWAGPGSLDTVTAHPVDVLIGCGGVVYQPRLLELPALFASAPEEGEQCRRVDDVLFASNLELRGTPRLKLDPIVSDRQWDWNNRRGRADAISALAEDRVRRYRDNCECALRWNDKHGVWKRGR